jgi:hypothetical protein
MKATKKKDDSEVISIPGYANFRLQFIFLISSFICSLFRHAMKFIHIYDVLVNKK